MSPTVLAIVSLSKEQRLALTSGGALGESNMHPVCAEQPFCEIQDYPKPKLWVSSQKTQKC